MLQTARACAGARLFAKSPGLPCAMACILTVSLGMRRLSGYAPSRACRHATDFAVTLTACRPGFSTCSVLPAAGSLSDSGITFSTHPASGSAGCLGMIRTLWMCPANISVRFTEAIGFIAFGTVPIEAMPVTLATLAIPAIPALPVTLRYLAGRRT